MKERKFCPVQDTECPYYDDKHCFLKHPENECEDYIAYEEGEE